MSGERGAKTTRVCVHCDQERPLDHYPPIAKRRHGGSLVCNTCAARTQQTVNQALALIATGTVDPDDFAWQEHARCVDWHPDVFYPERGESTRPARAVCASCDVRVECLAYALVANEEWGVWGGLAARERRTARRVRHVRLLAVAS